MKNKYYFNVMKQHDFLLNEYCFKIAFQNAYIQFLHITQKEDINNNK